MERQAWKLIVLLLLFCYVHSPYVKAQVGNGKQITMEFKNEGLPSIFKRLQKLSGYKVLFIYDEVRSYHSTGKVEKASIEEVLKVIIGKHPLKYVIEGQFINITHKNPQNVISEVKGKIIWSAAHPGHRQVRCLLWTSIRSRKWASSMPRKARMPRWIWPKRAAPRQRS